MTKEDLIELVKFTAGEIMAPTELSTEDAESILDDFLAVDKLTIPDVVGQSEQLPDENKHQCNCSNPKDRLDCGFECYNK